MGFWGLEESPPALKAGDRSVSEYCNGIFGFAASDKTNAALVDEFAEFFPTDDEFQEIESKPEVVAPVAAAPGRRFCIPTIPTANQNMPMFQASSNTDRSNVIKTKQEMKRIYRKNVAIPRYLKKRLNRKWEKELMHPSRSVAAQRRPRVGGQFGVVDARFTPCHQP
jgi:hypothetical protein